MMGIAKEYLVLLTKQINMLDLEQVVLNNKGNLL